MSDWDPALYSRFEAERTRPARDLLDRVPLDRPQTVVDLGCGPGNSTELLAARYPHADILGIDASAPMIAAARARLPTHRFDEADILVWRATTPPDLIFANAVIQWLPDVQSVLKRLFSMLRPGGVLAVQMPDNLDEPSHRSMHDVAADGTWRDKLAGAAGRREHLPALEAIYDGLCHDAQAIDLWRTIYQHVMPSPAAIVDWVRATGLRPFLDPLSAEETSEFLSRYTRAIDRAYPVRADSCRLLAFPRLFIVAVRRGP